MKTEQAIKFFEEEIRFCERAPAGNIAQQNGDWTMVLESDKAALAALKEKLERENLKPLTEDELRQMLGEPVWCVYEGYGQWLLVGASLFTIINGVTVYRYKPREVQA